MEIKNQLQNKISASKSLISKHNAFESNIRNDKINDLNIELSKPKTFNNIIEKEDFICSS